MEKETERESFPFGFVGRTIYVLPSWTELCNTLFTTTRGYQCNRSFPEIRDCPQATSHVTRTYLHQLLQAWRSTTLAERVRFLSFR